MSRCRCGTPSIGGSSSDTPRIMRRKFDVVNIHGYRDYIYRRWRRLARIPAVVMTRHLPHPFRSRVRARLCSRAFYDGIIAVSDFVKHVLLDSGVPGERVAVVHNGVRKSPRIAGGRAFRREFDVPEDAFLVGAAGRIEPQKGFEVLVRAMRKVDGYCVIFGSGDRSELESLCVAWGWQSAFGFRGSAMTSRGCGRAPTSPQFPQLRPIAFLMSPSRRSRQVRR